jgi:putative flippase GtrA
MPGWATIERPNYCIADAIGSAKERTAGEHRHIHLSNIIFTGKASEVIRDGRIKDQRRRTSVPCRMLFWLKCGNWEFSAMYSIKTQHKQILRYYLGFAAVGVVNSVGGLAAIFALMYFWRFSDLQANTVVYAIGIPLSFTLNKYLTFRHNGKYLRSLLLYGIVLACSYLANLGVIIVCSWYLRVSPYLAQIAGMIVYSTASFAGVRYFVFREEPSRDE